MDENRSLASTKLHQDNSISHNKAATPLIFQSLFSHSREPINCLNSSPKSNKCNNYTWFLIHLKFLTHDLIIHEFHPYVSPLYDILSNILSNVHWNHSQPSVSLSESLKSLLSCMRYFRLWRMDATSFPEYVAYVGSDSLVLGRWNSLKYMLISAE